MSVDLAIWEGEQPEAERAGDVFDDLYERYIEADDAVPPSDAIRAFVDALLARWPDLSELDDDRLDESPWADGPLIGNARGPVIYFGLVAANPAAGEAWDYAVKTASAMGLVALDPQSGELLSAD